MWCSLRIICFCEIFIAVGIPPGESARPRIVNGNSVKIDNRPFMVHAINSFFVSLHHGITGFLCGGSILSERWVLTAYHCMPEMEDPEEYYVRAGSTYLHEGGSIRWLKDAVYFENTEVNSPENIPKNDLLLLRLKKRLKFSKRIKPINLPRPDKEPPGKLWVSGWGRTSNKEISSALQIVQVNYIPYGECLKDVDWYPKVVSNVTHLCYFRESYDACQGDSGGPLATNRTIYGIVSFGDGCGTTPGVYTKVSHYRNWINKVIKSRRRIPRRNFDPLL